MAGAINFYKQASTQDDLAAGFITELKALEPAEQVQEITTAEMVGLVIKCANQLEEAQLDTTVADETLAFLETELL